MVNFIARKSLGWWWWWWIRINENIKFIFGFGFGLEILAINWMKTKKMRIVVMVRMTRKIEYCLFVSFFLSQFPFNPILNGPIFIGNENINRQVFCYLICQCKKCSFTAPPSSSYPQASLSLSLSLLPPVLNIIILFK